ncbi:elastin-like [Salvia hispanica]|uniref:elastin-like n=1 Tax=Salvia hispanica TaxID=49212 RepID=UPI00200976A6|nr:elastin-like [Salvia hispanica]
MEYNRNSPTTSGGNTPSIPIGAEGNFAGMNPRMAGMGGMPTMTPQMFYNMYTWMSQMGQMMPGAAGMPANMSGMGGTAGMGGMPPNMAGMGVTMPGAAGMGGMPPNIAGVGGMVPGAVGMGGTPPNMSETQYAGIETFSFEDVGLSPIRETPREAGLQGAGEKAGKATAGRG